MACDFIKVVSITGEYYYIYKKSGERIDKINHSIEIEDTYRELEDDCGNIYFYNKEKDILTYKLKDIIKDNSSKTIQNYKCNNICSKKNISKPQSKPCPKPQSKPCPKPQSKPCPKPQSKPCPKPQSKPCPKPQSKPCPKQQIKLSPKKKPYSKTNKNRCGENRVCNKLLKEYNVPCKKTSPKQIRNKENCNTNNCEVRRDKFIKKPYIPCLDLCEKRSCDVLITSKQINGLQLVIGKSRYTVPFEITVNLRDYNFNQIRLEGLIKWICWRGAKGLHTILNKCFTDNQSVNISDIVIKDIFGLSNYTDRYHFDIREDRLFSKERDVHWSKNNRIYQIMNAYFKNCHCCRRCKQSKCMCCKTCLHYPCRCCQVCLEYPCRCCVNCNNYPCRCCRRCKRPNCECCKTCLKFPCECYVTTTTQFCSRCKYNPCICCKQCHHPQCICIKNQICLNCKNYPCECCNECGKYPCICLCGVCGLSPCICCKECGQFVCECRTRQTKCININPLDRPMRLNLNIAYGYKETRKEYTRVKFNLVLLNPELSKYKIEEMIRARNVSNPRGYDLPNKNIPYCIDKPINYPVSKDCCSDLNYLSGDQPESPNILPCSTKKKIDNFNLNCNNNNIPQHYPQVTSNCVSHILNNTQSESNLCQPTNLPQQQRGNHQIKSGPFLTQQNQNNISNCQSMYNPNCQPMNNPNCQPMNNPNCQPMNNPNCQPMNNSNCQPMNNPNCQPMNNPNCQPMNNPNCQPMNNPNCQPMNNPNCQHMDSYCQPKNLPEDYPINTNNNIIRSNNTNFRCYQTPVNPNCNINIPQNIQWTNTQFGKQGIQNTNVHYPGRTNVNTQGFFGQN